MVSAPTVVVHSYRGGAGKTATAVNVALQLAYHGAKVGLLDLDFVNPGLATFFGSFSSRSTASLADFLVGQIPIEQTVYTPDIGPVSGALHVVQSRSTLSMARRILGHGYDVGLLREALATLQSTLGLDLLVLDTHSGVNNESLAAMACSDLLLIVTRPDAFDTAAAREESKLADIYGPRQRLLVVNAAGATALPAQRLEYLQSMHKCPVRVILPRSDEAAMGSGQSAISQTMPEHPLAVAYRQLAQIVLETLRPDFDQPWR